MPNATNIQHNKRKMIDQVWNRGPPNYWMSAFVSLLSGLISWNIWYCQPNTSQWSPDISAMARHHIFRVLWTEKTLTRSVWDRRIGRLMLTQPTPNLINIVDTVNIFQSKKLRETEPITFQMIIRQQWNDNFSMDKQATQSISEGTLSSGLV